MNLNKEDLERMCNNIPEEEEKGEMVDTSYVMDDVKEIMNRIRLYNDKKIDRHLSMEQFKEKLDRDYKRLKDNFPSIYDKTLIGTLELERLEFMLKMANEIKTSKITRHQASVVVGQELVDNIVKPTLE
jgi:hypothetical protein